VLQALAPPVGFVDVRRFPAQSATTHSLTDAHDTAERPTPFTFGGGADSTLVTDHADALPNG
jgi:hypothetical protein